MGGVVGKLLKSLSCRSACTSGDTKVAELGYQPRGGFYFDDYDLKVKDLVRITKQNVGEAKEECHAASKPCIVDTAP